MSEVNKPVEHMATGRPEAGSYYANLYNAAQSKLAALREELAGTKANLIDYQQRLAAAEQRNAVLTSNLRIARGCLGDISKGNASSYTVIREMASRTFKATFVPESTESGASE